MPTRRNLTVRVDEQTLQEIDRVAQLERSDRSAVTRRLIKTGLEEAKKNQALRAYREGRCTLWKAASLADLSLREMMELAEKAKAPLHLSPEDVEEAWREALGE